MCLLGQIHERYWFNSHYDDFLDNCTKTSPWLRPTQSLVIPSIIVTGPLGSPSKDRMIFRVVAWLWIRQNILNMLKNWPMSKKCRSILVKSWFSHPNMYSERVFLHNHNNNFVIILATVVWHIVQQNYHKMHVKRAAFCRTTGHLSRCCTKKNVIVH